MSKIDTKVYAYIKVFKQVKMIRINKYENCLAK